MFIQLLMLVIRCSDMFKRTAISEAMKLSRIITHTLISLSVSLYFGKVIIL